MVVDYSKWDKLELSDDSDVEVHPNVDKRSFIRMKQRQIHQQREEMKHNLTQLEISLEMNNDLVERINQLIKAGEADPETLKDVKKAVAASERGFESKKQPARDTNPNGPKYNDMIESLMEKIQEDLKKEGAEGSSAAVVTDKLKQHLETLHGVIAGQQKQYDELLEERSRHILSEDIHTGFDSTFIKKQDAAPKEAAQKGESSSSAAAAAAASKSDSQAAGSASKNKQATNSTTTTEQVEVLNQSDHAAAASDSNNDGDEDVQCSKEALEYLKIPKGDFQKCYGYLTKYPKLLSEKEKDGMLMVGFHQQLEGKTEEMKLTVYNAKIVEYCLTLGPDGVRLFFSKAASSSTSSPVLGALQKDVDLVVNHIIERCKVISQEQQDQHEPVEQIQLHAVDPNTEITVTVPDGTTNPEGLAVYESFSEELRAAIQTRKLDEINKVLANMSVEEAEDTVKRFDECGVLQVEEKVYDMEEWQRKKEAGELD